MIGVGALVVQVDAALGVDALHLSARGEDAVAHEEVDQRLVGGKQQDLGVIGGLPVAEDLDELGLGRRGRRPRSGNRLMIALASPILTAMGLSVPASDLLLDAGDTPWPARRSAGRSSGTSARR